MSGSHAPTEENDVGSVNESSSPAHEESPPSLSLEDLTESMVRITLAGLGGSMLGLSQERKLESMRVVTGAAATAAARRKRAPAAQLANLPLTWALSCMAFCAIVEASRKASLSSQVLSLVLDDPSSDNGTMSPDEETKSPASQQIDPRIRSFFGTVADFTFGGAVGGFAASMGRNSHLRKQLPSSMLRGSQRFFGVVPGISLGLLAGIIQASTDAGINYLEQLQR